MVREVRNNRNRAKAQGATRRQDESGMVFPWRRLVSICLGVLLISGALMGGGRALRALDQPLREVSIDGQLRHLGVQQIEQLVQRRVDQGLFAADLEEVRQLLADEPWLQQVAVRRKWPDLLHVELVEREPYLRWNESQLMTASGDVFKPREGIDRFQLPVLTGEYQSRLEILSRYEWLSGQLAANGLTIARLEKEQRGAWRVQLSTATWIYMGRESIEQKVTRFNRLYQQVLRQRIDDIERVDLRYTHGVSVSWKTQHEQPVIQG